MMEPSASLVPAIPSTCRLGTMRGSSATRNACYSTSVASGATPREVDVTRLRRQLAALSIDSTRSAGTTPNAHRRGAAAKGSTRRCGPLPLIENETHSCGWLLMATFRLDLPELDAHNGGG